MTQGKLWAFFLNPFKTEALEYAKDFEFLLASKGIEVRKFIRGPDNKFEEFALSDFDLVLVFGGDGTFYKAAKIFRDVPIVTVNFGTKGFLCAFKPWPPNVLYERIKLSKKLGRVTKLSTLKVNVGARSFHAVGDVAVVHSDPGKVIRLDIDIDGSKLFAPADGVVVATSTGSTGYALSVGGPLVDMTLDAMVIAPIASQNFLIRPMVLPLTKEVKIWNLSKFQEAIVLCDGEEVIRLEPQEVLIIKKGDYKITLVLPPDFKILERWREITEY